MINFNFYCQEEKLSSNEVDEKLANELATLNHILLATVKDASAVENDQMIEVLPFRV